jgi:hypothetical protein
VLSCNGIIRPRTKKNKGPDMITTKSSLATDMKIGRLRILTIAYRTALVRCDCTNVRTVSLDSLERGESTSCGCSPPPRAKIFRLPSWKPERGR